MSFSVAGQRVVVAGGGRSGVAVAELLVSRGARVTLSDTAETLPQRAQLEARGVTVELGPHPPELFAGADLVVVSPGVPADHPAIEAARAAGVPVMGEVEVASRWLQGRVIAITGTKGKSTTTTLIGRMLAEGGIKAAVGGNIGVPLSAQVEASTADTVHVVEVSSFQLETTTTFRPWISLWLNLADDHLDRHANLDEYAAAKARIFARQGAGDVAVINADDPAVVRWSRGIAARTVAFSPTGRVAEGYMAEGGWIVHRTATSADRLVPVSAVELPGAHMLGNVVAAVAVAATAGATAEAMTRALHGFRGLEHVLEPVAARGGVRFVNDSKATNVEAAKRSIESFERGVVAIVGGRFKGGDLRALREPLTARGRAVVAIGEAAPLVVEALTGVVPVVTAVSMRDAVEQAYRAAQPDGVVLLAPACTSFDWFADYAERGRVFKQEVERL
jgi:UDP-N-acetylmuramoylalanine--D-glutamate ligase